MDGATTQSNNLNDDDDDNNNISKHDVKSFFSPFYCVLSVLKNGSVFFCVCYCCWIFNGAFHVSLKSRSGFFCCCCFELRSKRQHRTATMKNWQSAKCIETNPLFFALENIEYQKNERCIHAKQNNTKQWIWHERMNRFKRWTANINHCRGKASQQKPP